MPSKMNRNPDDINELKTLEFTPRQLIFAICLLLVLAAGLIIIGIQIGRWETAKQTILTKNDSGMPMPGATSETTQTASSGEGQQITPRTAPAKVTNEATAPTLAAEATKGESKQPFVEVPAPPSPDARPSSSPSETSTASTSAPKENNLSQSLPQENPGILPQETSQTTASQANEQQSTEKPSQTSPEVSSPKSEAIDLVSEETANLDPKTEAGAVSTSGYAVQIAAIPVSRKEDAEKYVKKIAHLQPYIRPSEDNKFLRILVGNFPDKASAERKCSELKKTKEFAGSFVRKL